MFQQCLCTCVPVLGARAPYPIACGTPAMFTSHVSAMPLHVRACGGRACIVSDACGTPAMFPSHVYVSPSCQCGPKELPKPRHSAKLKKHAAVDAGLCV